MSKHPARPRSTWAQAEDSRQLAEQLQSKMEAGPSDTRSSGKGTIFSCTIEINDDLIAQPIPKAQGWAPSSPCL